ncbi:escargot [Anopheles darlingi]|uniref:Escargot/snail protein homolog n=1 Tax=Anopheles darlingi TaxID=43151 RepID=W5JNG1_ANODA|nr:escargot [Anopheles darlingi]
MPTSIMQKNYSHCPLKKRPVFMMKDAELALKNDSESEMEPENLSTKPQDLSMKSKKKARSVSPASPVSVVMIKTEDSLPTPPPSSSPSPSETTKSPISIPTPTYGTLPSIYYPTARSPLSPASSNNGTVAAAAAAAGSMQDVLYKSFSSVYPAAVAGYPGFPYTMPYPADFYSAAAYHHHHSRQQSFHHQHQQQQSQEQPQQPHLSQISPPRSEPLSPYSAGQRDRSPSASPTTHLFRPERRSLSPPPSMVVPSYPAELRLTQNNSNIIKSEPFARSQHRYMPYALGPHHPHQHPHHQPHLHHHHHHAQHPHLMMASSHHNIDHPSLSPTSSHTSFNSYLSSSRGRSLSPASASPGSVSLSEENNNSLTATNGNNVLTEKSTSSSNIQEHKEAGDKSSATGEKGSSTGGAAPRYQCPDCGKSYSTYSGLSKHQQFHCPAAEGNQAQKTFVCKECDKPYKTLGALKMHIRTHTLPCKCNLCDKAFSRPWLLQGHIRTHTGEKPFVCKLCQRAFADRSNLRAHQQTHEDVKRFKCPTCTKSFSRLPLLTKHAETGCPGGSGAGSPVPSHPDSPGSIDGGRCHSPDPSCQDESKFIPTVLPHATNSGNNSANIANIAVY